VIDDDAPGPASPILISSKEVRMKRLWTVAALFLAASCASRPIPSPEPGPEPEKPARRTEEYRVPVVIKETVMFADGVVESVVEYAYDEGYARLLSAVASEPGSPDPVERVEYEYSGERLAAKATFGAGGVPSARSEYAYDGDGFLVGETIEDGAGVVQSVSEWRWGEGRKASWRVLSAAGLALARTDYSYEGDALATARMYDGAGLLKGRAEYAYADGAELSGVEYFNAAGSRDGRIEYVRADGRLIRESVYRADGRLERRLSYEYSPDGALIKKILADSSGKTREIIRYDNAYRTETRIVASE